MNVTEEVKKEESKLNESSLTDLPVSDEQAGSTKGGEGYEKQIQVESFSWGATNSGGFVR